MVLGLKIRVSPKAVFFFILNNVYMSVVAALGNTHLLFTQSCDPTGKKETVRYSEDYNVK